MATGGHLISVSFSEKENGFHVTLDAFVDSELPRLLPVSGNLLGAHSNRLVSLSDRVLVGLLEVLSHYKQNELPPFES